MAAGYILKSGPLSRSAAEALSASLEEAADPEAGAVSLIEVDESAGLWRVEALYEEEPDLTPLAELGRGFVLEALPVLDWVARSLEGLAPVRAGRFIVHGAHDRVRLPPGGVPVEIDAGTAFGTGHHASTLGCLLAADAIFKRRRPRRVLDVGCGSGVLAIAAARATHASALAIDTDPEAVRVTRANARVNRVGNTVTAAIAPAAGRRHDARLGKFDLLFANILARPLQALAPRLAPRVSRAGALVLAGITVEQERALIAAYRGRNLVLVRRIRAGGWTTLVLKRGPRRAAPGGAEARRARSRKPVIGGPVRISGRLRPIPSGGSRCA